MFHNNNTPKNSLISEVENSIRSLCTAINQYCALLKNTTFNQQEIGKTFNEIWDGLNYLDTVLHNHFYLENFKYNLSQCREAFVKLWLEDLIIRIKNVASREILEDLQAELNKAHEYFNSTLINSEISKKFDSVQKFGYDLHIALDNYSPRLSTKKVLTTTLFQTPKTRSVNTPPPASSPVEIRRGTQSTGTPVSTPKKVTFSDTLQEEAYESYVSYVSDASDSLLKQSLQNSLKKKR